ncbi:Helicase conserved C-terminal domain-containing protein [Nonomuraea solani]|uniref:Helicase conserved C-terminal domain-containing protein n=1 Tax=Nonomuraea solani TaxID=1144553 RepID=A0A1H6EWZ2_9ACTN|nr:DEAD/DEAH box helicase [Nonomuraea solani]SEH01399.1 Helicase conserved C-terminal domain-containing protein [Nonomuraea solani]
MTLLTDLARHAALFQPGDPPRTGRLVFLDPDGTSTVTVAEEHDGDVRIREVPATLVPVGEAVAALARARTDQAAHPASRFWGAAALIALQLVTRGRILPGVTTGEHDSWRAGPLDPADLERIRELAAAMPATARAVPITESGLLPEAEPLLRAFLDAVADAMPRSPGAVRATGTTAYAAAKPVKVPHLRRWAEEVSAGLDAGVRPSLRLEADDLAAAEFRAVVQLHSLADPSLVADAADLWEGRVPAFGPRARIETTLALRRATRAWPRLERLLDNAVPDELALTDGDVEELLAGAADRLAAAGIDVHWPKSLVRGLSARAVIGDRDPVPSDMPSFLGGTHLTSFDWQLALGGERLTAAEMDHLAEAHRPVVRLRDQWVLIDPDLARKARQRDLKPLNGIEALGAALTGTVEVEGEQVPVEPTTWLRELRERLAEPADADPPEGLAATLRDYQLAGLRWLVRMTSLGLGACLADDMGLGKTITLIALHLHRAAGPTLVVCPASLLGNWEREITKFAPGVPVHRYHGPNRTLADEGFVLTTYATMRLDAARLAAHPWDLLVADEAQHVKNPASGTAKALREIPAAARVALTGTPVENNLSELWAILDWSTPGLLGSLGRFRARWAKPVESGDRATAERLSRLVGPFLLRRRKSDPGIAPELPPKTETDRPVALTTEQAGLYEAVVREIMAQIAGAHGMARRGLIVKLLTGLKQICNHPAQYLHEADPRLPGRSGKLELLDELVDTIVAEDGAVLVFTQYVAMARLLERHLTARGVTTQLLHGGTPVPRREEMVQRFQDGRAPVFLLSLKAAGTGLNLTRADHVIHFDRWWNPAVEDQATDRAYRIGQTRPVQVHRLIAEGTIEDRIAEMLVAKRSLADAVLASGEAAFTELTDAELSALVELR